MVYTLEEISRLVQPVAEKYHLKAVYIFGSYARSEAQDNSDIDVLVDLTGADLSALRLAASTTTWRMHCRSASVS